MSKPRKIRDPIHGFVELSTRECDILDTAVFQRLRGIRQLAFAHLVYPGALHTRFDHSLGVCHVAGLLSNALELKDEKRELVRLGCLLHDLGHGPFSHVAEDALQIFTNRQVTSSQVNKRHVHELITEDIILTDEELNLTPTDRKRITDLLSDRTGEPLLRSIISGPLDADKQDYLLRDSYFCGVKYGLYDLEQLLRQLRAMNLQGGSKELVVSRDGINALEQFIMAKYFLTTQVYRHKIRLITDQMLVRAIRLGIEVDGIEELSRLFSYKKSGEFLDYYTKFDDAKFLQTFLSDKFQGTNCHALLERLCQRRLLKRVFSRRLVDMPEECRVPLSQVSEPDSADLRRFVEREVSQEVEKVAKDVGCCEPIDPRHVIVHAYTVKSVRLQSKDDEKQILVEWRPGQPRPFEEASSLFHSIDQTLNEGYVEVYAPVDYGNMEQRRLIETKLDEPLIDAMKRALLKGADHENS